MGAARVRGLRLGVVAACSAGSGSAAGPLSPDFSTVPEAPGVTGSYVNNFFGYASSIDSAVADIKTYATYDVGAANAAIADGRKLPILWMAHGYSQDAGAISDDMRVEAARHGFVAVAPAMRGRQGGDGSADDSCRELVDIEDAFQAVHDLYPTVVDIDRVHAWGFSGGCGNLVSFVAKHPGRIITAVGNFGWGDYGYSDVLGHSYWASGDNPTEVVNRIGPRSDLQPYLARLALQNISAAMKQSNGQLWLFWDEDDDIGICLRDVRGQLLADGVPTSKWYADESTAADDVRWEHGYPYTVPDLAQQANLIYRRVAEPAPTVASSGTIVVTGHCVHAAGFEVWTAATGVANPKTHATGGQRFVATVTFNANTRHFTVSRGCAPLSPALDCAVRISMGGSAVTHDVTSDGVTFDIP